MALAEGTLALAPDVQGPEAAIRLRGVQPGDDIGVAWRVYGWRLGENAVAPCAQIAHLLQTDWGCATVSDMGALLEGEMKELLSHEDVQKQRWMSAIERNFHVHFRRTRAEPQSAVALTSSNSSASSAAPSEKGETKTETKTNLASRP
jgi:hypothetical protein